MKMVWRLLLSVFGAILISAALPAQEVALPRVAILPLQQVGEDPRLQPIAETIHASITTVLHLINRYAVVTVSDAAALREHAVSDDQKLIEQIARDEAVENLIFGTVRTDAAGVVLELAVYNRVEAAVTVRETAVAEDLFDIFSVSDALLSRVVEGFSGIRLAFGSIRLSPHGTPRQYSVAVDGQELGGNLVIVEPVPTGNHTVRVTQERPGGSVVLFDDTISVMEGEAVALSFEVPFLTTEERSVLLSPEIALLESLTTGTTGETDIDETLLEEFVSWAPGYEGLRQGRIAFLEALKVTDPFVDAKTTTIHTEGGSSTSFVGARLTSLMGNDTGARDVPFGRITVDGDVTEWQQQAIPENVHSGFDSSGRNVVAWAVARDETHLFVRVRYSETPTTDGENRYRVMLFQRRKGRTDGDLEFGFNYRHGNSKDTDLYVARGDDWLSPGFSSYGIATAVNGNDAELRVRLDHLPESPTLEIRAYIHGTDNRTDMVTYQINTLGTLVAR